MAEVVAALLVEHVINVLVQVKARLSFHVVQNISTWNTDAIQSSSYLLNFCKNKLNTYFSISISLLLSNQIK